jgi:hypothetical protein
MFYSGDHVILMKYRNKKTSVMDTTAGFITLARYVNGRTEFLVDNLQGEKEWMPQNKAFKVSPALHQTMLDKYVERYKKIGGSKEKFKADIFKLIIAKAK